MNNPSKIDVKLSVDAKLPGDGLGAHAHGHGNIFCSPHPRSDEVSDSNLAFNGDFGRSGVDLIVSKDDREPVLQDCFRSEKRAALSSPDGAQLTGNIVNALTGHVEYAEAEGAPDAAKVIGHIQTAIGSGTLTRACGIAVQAKVGAPVCQGDVIETAADGRVGLRFIDDTCFRLSGGARMVLDEFVCDGNGTSHSALFGVTRGTFAFIVGQVAETGCLRIDTPVGSIRGRARTGGIGMMSLTALIFSLMKEVEAAEFSSQRPLLDSLDDDKINPKDLQLNGTIELFTRDGRHYILDDPSQTIVVSGSGSISVVANSATQMAELQRFQQEAVAAYALGTGPTSTGRGGSSTSPSLLLSPQGLQPINFDQPAPQNLRGATTQSASFSPTILLEAPVPSKPPVLTLAVITPMVGNSSVNTAHTLNAIGASIGFTINGTTDGVENGQPVMVTIVNSSGVTVETFTSTVANNAWSINVSPANARALIDGNYTVTADVSNAAGTGTARASQKVTVDQTPPAPPGAVLTSDSGSSNSDHITNVGALSLSGIESGATVEYSINGGASWTTSFTPVEGLNTVLVRQTDAAGNVSGVSALNFILGTTPPGVTFDAVSFTDTGVQGDHITDNGQVTLSGTVSDNVTVSQVQVFNGSQLLGAATVDNVHHTWTLTMTLAPGAYNQLNATAIDEAGNPGNATTTQTVQVNGAPVITSGAAAARVSEEGLANGVPDTLPAGLDTTNSTSASGTITATDVDGDALTMSLGTPSASLTSGGVAIAWTLQDAGHTLIGKAGAATIITATITDAGTYNVALSGPIDHSTANQEDNTTFTVPVIVSDGHTTTPTTLSVTIEDDSPKAEPVEVPVDLTSKTNVMLILDLSGSMATSSGLTGLTRLDVAKAAINELLDQYDNRGDVMVRIVTFSDTGAAVGSTWQSVADAKAAIAGLSAGGNTNYDAALLTAMGAFTDGTKLTGPGTQNVSYFLSDGDPTASSDWPQIPGTQLANGIQANEQAVWESFLTTNKIVSFGLGIPNVGTPANLDPIAFDPAPGAQLADTPIIVTDLGQLTNDLVFTIPPVTGGVLAGAVGAPPNSFGADGGFVRSITVDGVTYTFNPAANGGAGGITTSGGGNFTYDGTTKTLTVDTDTNVVGGELAMVMTTGAFTFQPSAGFSSKSVGFVLVDRDGDTAGSTIDFSAAGGSDQPPGSNLTALIPSHILPAGVSGSPMNLGLTDPADHVGTVTVAIAGVPSGWTLSEGTNNGDGSWTIQASSVSMLSIASPADYTGAMALEVTMSWTNADGSSGFARATDNVEVFAQGAPVFAWSGEDHLTGSSGKDLFVFAQPIGHDTIYSFDAAHDQLDLIGYAGFTSFADIGAHLADDVNGDAVITLGDGQSIELHGVHAGALTENNFVFDQTPTVDNAATMTIGDGALLPLSGTIVNTGTIALNSTGDETDLQLIEHGVTLEGGGKILLSDSDANIISGTNSGVTLNNEDNTISGAGQLGNGELTLTNAGTIDATGTHALTIDTGSNLVTNSGVLEASGSGGMMVASGIVNSGVLWANGATLTVQGAVSGNGTATIDGIGTLDFEASTTANVVFGSGTGGTLKLGDSFHFNGTISGFGGSDVIDLANVAAANASISYHENAAGTGGTLAISDGAQTLELSLLGHYSADNFSIVPDQLHGTSITYVPHDLML